MRSQKVWIVAVSGVLVGAISLQALPAVAAEVTPVSSTSATAQSAANLRYSDLDMVDFFVFARGRIATDRPDLVKQFNLTPVLDAPASVSQQLLRDLLSVDPQFHQQVTVNAQAHDPYAAKAAIDAFTKDINAVAAQHEVKPSQIQAAASTSKKNKSTGQVYAFSNYVVSVQAVVTAVAAVSVLAVVAALAIFAYQHPDDLPAITQQKYAADLAQL